MRAELTIAIAQTNPTVGDVAGNLERIRAWRGRAAAAGADLVIFSELVLVGYPPEDLVLKPALQEAARAAALALAADTGDGGPAVILGAPWVDQGKLYNAMLLLQGGRLASARYKYDLPNYGVFDEKRVFAQGPVPGPMAFPLPGGDQLRIGGMVCEDMWTGEVAEALQESGAEILIVPNGSPFEHDKLDVRLNLAVARVTETGLPLIYCNQVGGQDELVFDGASFVLDADRRLAAQARGFEEQLLITRWQRGEGEVWRCIEGDLAEPVTGLEAIYRAMCLGLADYVDKNRFPGVVLGLSGGIDFGALGRGRGRCLGACPRACGDDAVPLHLERQPRGRARRSAGARHPYRQRADRARGRGLFDDARAAVRRPRARHHGREPAGAHPRRVADGDLEQAGLDGAHHRQQIGNVGRLRDPLRRHVRRVFRPQGRLQDDRVRALQLAQPAPADGREGARGPGDPRADHHQAAVRRAARGPDRPGQPAAL